MPLPKFSSVKKTTLQASITAAETDSIVLKKLVDIYDNALAMSDFTTNIYLTIEPGTENEEIISATDFTVNSDGTATLDTGIARGLAAKSPYDATGTARPHAAGVIVMISNQPQLYDSMMNFLVDNETAETIAGKKTFSTVPASIAAPVAGDDLGNKTYIDAAGIGAATSVAIIVTGKAGETIADGDLIYFDTVTNNEWMKCDADTAATVENVQLGIAQGAGTNGNDIANGVMLRGVDDAQSGLVAGEIMYAGNTAGAIQNTPGTTEVTIGIVPAGSTTKVYFSPRFNQQLTEDQQDALAGSNGTPGATNKYVTEEGTQDSTNVYAADAEANDTYVISLSPALTAYTAGQVFHFKANTANTGACTLNVNGLGAKSIKKLNDQDPATGDIEAGQIVTVVYDGTSFQMQSQIANNPRPDNEAEVFTADGTWIKPSGAIRVEVFAFGAGGGGGSGARASAQAGGGGGGGGGGVAFKRFLASALASAESIIVGVAGSGGAGVADSTIASGNVGVAGGDSTFSSVGNLITAGGGGGGGAGTNSAGGAAGSAGTKDTSGDTESEYGLTAGAGGAGHATGNGAAASGLTTLPASGRGGGGGGGTAGTNTSGGAGGTNVHTTFHAVYGFPKGLNGSQSPFAYMLAIAGGAGASGHGSGGGGASGAGTAGSGAGAGGGGSGGQDSDNSTSGSGVGGAGSDGLVIVVSYF